MGILGDIKKKKTHASNDNYVHHDKADNDHKKHDNYIQDK